MFDKIKNSKTIDHLSLNLGISIMTLATVVGMLELPSHSLNRIVLPMRPVTEEANLLDEANNPLRREKEESVSQYVSYSESQRTPSRSGKY